MALADGDDDELAAIIVREALAAIAATDAAPGAADEGEDEGGSGAARGGAAGRPKSWAEWEAFSKRVETGEAYLSVAIDFRRRRPAARGQRADGAQVLLPRPHGWLDDALRRARAHNRPEEGPQEHGPGAPAALHHLVNAWYASSSSLTAQMPAGQRPALSCAKEPGAAAAVE